MVLILSFISLQHLNYTSFVGLNKVVVNSQLKERTQYKDIDSSFALAKSALSSDDEWFDCLDIDSICIGAVDGDGFFPILLPALDDQVSDLFTINKDPISILVRKDDASEGYTVKVTVGKRTSEKTLIKDLYGKVKYI
jgi:hypothetical protein